MPQAYSKQGINIAFIGIDEYAQAACAGYIKRKLHFKPLNLDDGLRHFLRTVYGYHEHFKLNRSEVREYYDVLHKINPDIWITQFSRNFTKSPSDVVTRDIRYLNELEALRKLGFVICRVTSNPKNRKNLIKYVKTADTGTVALSLLYDKTFAHNYNVDYSVNFTNYGNLPAIIEPFVADLGYKFDT